MAQFDVEIDRARDKDLEMSLRISTQMYLSRAARKLDMYIGYYLRAGDQTVSRNAERIRQ